MGQRCITDTEVYRNHTDVPQERCMWHCLQNISCTVINYNMVDSYCLLGQGPCVSLEHENDFVTIPMTTQEPCMTWIRQDSMPPSLDDFSDIVMYQVHTNPNNIIVVARAIIDSAKIPGKFHTDEGRFALNGQVVEFSSGNYEILRISPECDISWVNYGPVSGNTLIDGAVIGGYQNGHPLYVARKGDTHSGDSYRYAAGYYDAIDMVGVVTYGTSVLPFTEMEILVVHG